MGRSQPRALFCWSKISMGSLGVSGWARPSYSILGRLQILAKASCRLFVHSCHRVRQRTTMATSTLTCFVVSRLGILVSELAPPIFPSSESRSFRNGGCARVTLAGLRTTTILLELVSTLNVLVCPDLIKWCSPWRRRPSYGIHSLICGARCWWKLSLVPGMVGCESKW